MRPPVQVDAAVNAPEGHPSNCRLMGFGVTPAFCSALIASTMLFAAPFAPPPSDAVVGAAVIRGVPTKELRAPLAPQKKSLCFLSCPPPGPPPSPPPLAAPRLRPPSNHTRLI